MRVLVLCLPVLLGGCACIQWVECSAPTEQTPSPSDRPETTAPVGGTVYSEANYWTKTVNRLLGGLQTSLGSGEVSVAAGDVVLKENVNGQIAYCTENPAYIIPSTGPVRSACFIDADNDGRFETVAAAVEGRWLEKEIAQPIRYTRVGVALPDTDSVRYELLYSGIGNGSLKLSYREYRNDVARPDAFLDVSYDYRYKPTSISFRGVKIDVLSADNNQITYRVLKGF